MTDNIINVCRLCFSFVDKNNISASIENNDNIVDKLKLLALSCSKNLDATDDPLICTNCHDKINRFSQFKKDVALNEASIKSKQNNLQSKPDDTSRKRCRLCLISPAASTGDFQKNWRDVNTLLFECDIKLNFDIEEPQKICNLCNNHLQELSKFTQDCSEKENYIRQYFKRPEKLTSEDIIAILSSKVKQNDDKYDLEKATNKISTLTEHSNSEQQKGVDRTGKMDDNEKLIILQEMSKKILTNTGSKNNKLNRNIKNVSNNIESDDKVHEVQNIINGKIKESEKSIILEEMSKKILYNDDITITTENVKKNLSEITDDLCITNSMKKPSPRTYRKAKTSIKTEKLNLPKQIDIQISKNIDAENINVADVTLTTPDEYDPKIHGIEHIDDIIKINNQLEDDVQSPKPKVCESQIYIVNFETMSLNPCTDSSTTTKSPCHNYSIQFETCDMSNNNTEFDQENESNGNMQHTVLKSCEIEQSELSDNDQLGSNGIILNQLIELQPLKTRDDSSKQDEEFEDENQDTPDMNTDRIQSRKRLRKTNGMSSNQEKTIPKKKSRFVKQNERANVEKTNEIVALNNCDQVVTYRRNKTINKEIENNISMKVLATSNSEKETAKNLSKMEVIEKYSSDIQSTRKNSRITRAHTNKIKKQENVSQKPSNGIDSNECESEEISDVEDPAFVEINAMISSEDEDMDALINDKKKKVNQPVLRIIRSSRKTRNKAILEQTWKELTEGTSVETVKETSPKETVKKRTRKPKSNKEKTSKSTYFQCGSCPYKTISKNTLIQHQYIHTVLGNVKELKCSLCQFKAADEEVLKQHKATHESSTLLYVCVFCDYSSKKKVSVMNHTLHHDDKDVANLFYCSVQDHFNASEHYECFQCTYQTTNESDIPDHVIDHRRVEPIKNPVIAKFACTKCDYKTKDEELLERHQKLKHEKVKSRQKVNKGNKDGASNDTLFSCQLCQYKTFHERSLANHKSMKHYRKKPEKRVTDDTFYCAECSYVTNRKVNLARHALVHKTKESMEYYECAHCYFETKHRRSYTRHMQVRHQVII